jgi:hypothetical protein
MADTVAVKYLYPSDLLSGVWDEKSGNRRVIVQLTGNSDGSGETDVIKVHLSDLKTPNGNVPTRTAVEWIKWHVIGMTVVLEWDRAPHAEIHRMNGVDVISDGDIDWTKIGGYVDPGGDDRTGDILLTSTNVDVNDSYNLTICLRLKD